MDNLVVANQKNGVLTGWTLAQNATPNMSVDVATGTGFAGGNYVSTGSTTNVSITASHASLDRLDIIVMNNSGTLSSIAGVAATAPNPPDLPDNNICLAIITVDATVTAIYDADIISRRLLLGSIQEEMIGAGEIKNTHIAAGAAIAYSKLNLALSIVNADIAVGAAIAWSKLAVDPNVVFKNIAATITALWTYSNTQIIAGGNIIQFKDSGAIIQGEINALAAGSLRIRSYNSADILFNSANLTYQIIFCEASTSLGGYFPTGYETGTVGGVAGAGGLNPFYAMTAQYMYDTDGNLGSYSEREDLKDLRAIKELYHPDTGEKVRGSWGDPIIDAATIPPYIRSKRGYEVHGITEGDPKTGKTTTKLVKRPNRGYLSNSKWKGWMISLLQKLDGRDTIQEDELNLLKIEVLELKERLKVIESE